MNNNSLEQNIERMEQELTEMKAKLKAGGKWQPKGGPWVINVRGEVMSDSVVESRIPFGMTFQTQQQAEIASELMREHNRIIQYVLEHEPDWKFGYVVGRPNYYVYYDFKMYQMWKVGEVTTDVSQDIHMPEWVAKKLAVDLNSGRVKL